MSIVIIRQRDKVQNEKIDKRIEIIDTCSKIKTFYV